jgi:death-on-curing protein
VDQPDRGRGIHLDQIREHGGLGGLGDENALESALARPRQKWAYQRDADLQLLAAAYGFGLCRNHPFRDGNKRVAFLVLVVFLELNGLRVTAEDPDVVATIVALADGNVSKEELASWLRDHTIRSRGRGAV